jgi:hypothetical protein
MLAKGDTPPDDLRAQVDKLVELADGAHDEVLRDALFGFVHGEAREDTHAGESRRRVPIAVDAPVAVTAT